MSKSDVIYDLSSRSSHLSEDMKHGNCETAWGIDERCSYREIQREDPSHSAERSKKGCLEEELLNMDLLR